MQEKGLGLQLQAARRRCGFTQQQLCQKSGLSYSTLAKIERGAIKSPSIFNDSTDSLGIGSQYRRAYGRSGCGLPCSAKTHFKKWNFFRVFSILTVVW